VLSPRSCAAGNAPAGRGARRVPRRLFRRLRPALPDAVLQVQLDGGFASATLFAFLPAGGRVRRGDAQQRPAGEPSAAPARARPNALPPERADRTRLWRHLVCRPEWPRRRRVIITAEVERHHDLALHRTSCARFLANQFLLLPDRVHAVPAASPPRRGHGLRRGSSHHAARARAQARRVGRALGAPHRAALPPELPLAADVAAARRRHVVARASIHRLPAGRQGACHRFPAHIARHPRRPPKTAAHAAIHRGLAVGLRSLRHTSAGPRHGSLHS